MSRCEIPSPSFFFFFFFFCVLVLIYLHPQSRKKWIYFRHDLDISFGSWVNILNHDFAVKDVFNWTDGEVAGMDHVSVFVVRSRVRFSWR
jgi:hypothetical protein